MYVDLILIEWYCCMAQTSLTQNLKVGWVDEQTWLVQIKVMEFVWRTQSINLMLVLAYYGNIPYMARINLKCKVGVLRLDLLRMFKMKYVNLLLRRLLL